uniref:DZIP3-like HEPN domain-containing protein n=1 Tax=Magallana gigas TaxID=29159 RepID=K1QSE0_MAGGI
MALSKYDSTRETTNLARIARAILGPCVDVLRDILTKEITPPELKKELNKYPNKYRISQHQKQVVKNGDYSKFDISLLYMFLRNLGSIPEHKNKWGTNPDPYDKSVSANIERIRNFRNEWGHFTDLSLSDSDFEQHWKNIFQTVKDLEGYLGATTVYQDALNNLKTCCMDPDSIQPYIKKLLLVEQLVTDITDLKDEVQQIKKTIEPASLNGN